MAEDQITNVKLSFTCPETWDNMAPTQGGRHCDKCNKTVHNFTNSKIEEFRAIMAENSNGICGRFRIDQMAPAIIPGWKKWISAALVVIGFNIIGCQQKPIGKVVATNKSHADTTDNSLTGVVLAPLNTPDSLPQYPGGEKALFKFLKQNRHLIKDKAIGLIAISFDVDSNGTLSNYKVLKGLNPAIDSQALDVVRRMPKWQPATKNGKPIVFNYTIPYLITDKK